MKISPAVKGQVTRQLKVNGLTAAHPDLVAINEYRRLAVAREVLVKHMPREQAKHAARQLLGSR